MYSAEMVEQARFEARTTGEELPAWVTNAPVLRFGVALYFNAWFELDTERNRVRLEPIKRSTVFEYCRDYDLSESQTEDMWFYISRMDSPFLQWYATQVEASGNGKPDRPSS